MPPNEDKNLKSKRLFYCYTPLILIFFGSVIFHRPILNGVGRFLAPTSMESGEVLILAGNQVVKNGALKVGMRLLSEGRANRIVVVLLQFSEEDQVFPPQGKYTQFIINELEHLGLKKEKVEVISVPIDGHPITLAEARFVVAKLSQNGVRSAILLSRGFHTRRSFGVYSKEGERVGLRVAPTPYFINYNPDFWWYDVEGVIDFLRESLKLCYYILYGYVPIKYLRS